MKLEIARKAYYGATTKASDVTRGLAFAGIGVVWIFAIVKQGGIAIPAALYTALWFFVISLALDLLHYYVKGILWGSFAWKHEHEKDGSGKKKKDSKGEVIVKDDSADIANPDKKINWPTNILY